VARTRSPEVVKRNEIIYGEWLRGSSLTSLGEKYSLSRQVVGRIIAAEHPEGAEDEDRSVFRAFMWRLYDEVQDIGDKPGFKMRPDGRPAEDLDGKPALDTQVQVQCKDLQLKILRELRLLDARDKPQKRTLTVEMAQQEADASIAAIAAQREAERRELEEARRMAAQFAAIPGEVVRELPAAGG
jgi:hypothetical protein